MKNVNYKKINKTYMPFIVLTILISVVFLSIFQSDVVYAQDSANQKDNIVIIKDQDTLQPVPNASVKITRGTEFIATLITNTQGKTDKIKLNIGDTYTLEITATGYNIKQSTLTPGTGTGTAIRTVFLEPQNPTQKDAKVFVKDQDTLQPIENASVKITRGDEFIATLITKPDGKTDAIPLNIGDTYTLEITATGYKSNHPPSHQEQAQEQQ